MMAVAKFALLLVTLLMLTHDCQALEPSSGRLEEDEAPVVATSYELCIYTIVTETGKKTGAGTDSAISLRIMDKEGKEVYFPALDNGNNDFEKGSIDTFSLQGTCLTRFCKLILYTDYTGFFPSWFVETVSISLVIRGNESQKTWQLHQWLPKEDDATSPRFLIKDDC
ncbi:hypothetical protein MPTK1_1g08080 [Marchantia polymorpha subsp. ruderalis]|uniref:PLAT domain-containing protein n=2 Tax=Marchantia polymorpha TaxID=3197 RepID=A0A176VNM7_MARPO|nr:hypothetical protein AXG93_2117s1050 [Marchantia polymorpha subsp. ruderalis]PTQ41062.1 hypothetical protein MARPO_0036s0052 [Marchantia polymorpha]BBM97759.1 hypothetical protein Mp_1g08080 [Marchantia polymorpha subsp. ruderalis]|eukprot:PTQ41062.1 hypothetical protein MARPO_0036s0052 [Marchantia polymorpha]